MMRIAKRLTEHVFTGLLSVFVLLVGCTSNVGGTTIIGPTGSESTVNTPSGPHVGLPTVQTHSANPGIGLGDSQHQIPGPYAPEIEAAAKKAYSQFARDILADGVITRAEYLSAMNRFKACMEDHGVAVKLIDQNGYYAVRIDAESIQGKPSVEINCEKGTVFYIRGLYEKIVKNPERQNPIDQLYDCLKRVGLIPNGYTERDYIADRDASRVTITVGSGTPLNRPSRMPSPHYPFDAEDPRYAACINNPQNPALP